MNKKLITRVSLEEWAKMKGQTDWVKIDGLTEEEIEQNALNDPDNQPLPDEFWDEAEVIFPQTDAIADLVGWVEVTKPNISTQTSK